MQDRTSETVDMKRRVSEDVASVKHAFSQRLREDWVRLKERAGQDIDTLPDIVLAVGEGAQLCNGLTPIGVTRIGNNWATVNLGGDSQTMYSGARRAIGDDAWVDFIGPKNKKGLFRIHCSNA